MKPKYVQSNNEYVTINKEPTYASNVFRSLMHVENEGKNILTCRQTSDFIEACQKKRHFDKQYNAALRDFRNHKFEVQKSILSVPYEGLHEGVYLFEDEVDGFVSQEYADVPILLEDFKIIGGSRSFSIECETIKPLPKDVFDFSDRMSKPFADLIILEEDIPQLGLPKGAEIYAHPSAFSRPELYGIIRGGKDFATSIFELQGGFGKDALYYREIIRPESGHNV